jgi:hypothetical protein
MDRLNIFFLSCHSLGCVLVVLANALDQHMGGPDGTSAHAIRLFGAGLILILLASLLSLYSALTDTAVGDLLLRATPVVALFYFCVWFRGRAASQYAPPSC